MMYTDKLVKKGILLSIFLVILWKDKEALT